MKDGIKTVLKEWWNDFKISSNYRSVFLLAFYLAFLMSKTLLNLELWSNPLSDIMGGWGIYSTEGMITGECLSNLVMFFPLTFLVLLCFKEKCIKVFKFKNVFLFSVIFSGLMSAAIEFCQLFFRLGTFQVSDFIYNTLGGLLGGMVYYLLYKLKHKKKM